MWMALVKLIKLIDEHYEISYHRQAGEIVGILNTDELAANLITHGVTVQEHGYWETVVEVRDNTVCGNGVKIEYKRCSCCKNPQKFLGDDFCGHCGAKLDLPQPMKGETHDE